MYVYIDTDRDKHVYIGYAAKASLLWVGAWLFLVKKVSAEREEREKEEFSL